MLNKHEKKIIDECASQIDSVLSTLYEINDRHSERFNEFSDKYQESEKGMAYQEQLETLENIISDLQNGHDDLQGLE